MAKPMTLEPAIMSEAPPIPRAAQATAPLEVTTGNKPSKRLAVAEKREPLQVRWPAEDVKAAKLAAITQDFDTVSDFMLACFHAYMKNGSHK